LASNLAAVRARIAEAVRRVGRQLDEITLVAVSKTQPLEAIRRAFALGVRDFAENRVQEALSKIAAFSPPGLHWQMIGHVQSNKVSKVVGQFACIQSVDRLPLAELLNRHLAHLPDPGRRQAILLQVNISGEASKEGIDPAQAIRLARQIASLEHLEIQGLMTIAPFVSQAEEVRPIFRALRELRDRLQNEVPTCSWRHLSMGMTNDYPIAIEEGATILRIGRGIFGER
jgi:pyridoxal phosphate enzyme (YggS family)